MSVCKNIQQVQQKHSHAPQSLNLPTWEAVSKKKAIILNQCEFALHLTFFCYISKTSIIQMSRRGLLVDHPPRVQAEIGRRESSHRRRPDSGQRVDGEIPGRSTPHSKRSSLSQRVRENTVVVAVVAVQA